MPTVLYINGFRFFFYMNEHEPIHIHVEKVTEMLLNEADHNDVINIADDQDRFIQERGLRIQHFGFARDLDLGIFILSDKKVISRSLSSFPYLEKAEDWDLDQYVVSETGIHWPILDVDLSLRGLLQEKGILTNN